MLSLAYLTCLWPGLARLWWVGDFRAFGFSILFAGLLNFAAIYTVFPNPQWGPHWLVLMWVILVSWWGASIHSGWTELPFLMGMAIRLTTPQELSGAQVAYLKRDFVAAEGIIRKILSTRPDDPAAKLLLAATYRQTGRRVEARGLLLSLQRDSAAFAWQVEIQADLARLDRQEKATSEGGSPSPDVESKPRVVRANSVGGPKAAPARSTTMRKAA